MVKRQLIKVAIGLTLLLSLLSGGAALGASSPAAQVAPVHPQLACALIIYPPCI